MPRFAYQVFDRNGSARTGELEAASIDAARNELEDLGFTPVALEIVDDEASTAPSEPASVPKGAFLSDDDFIDVGQTIASLSAGSLPLDSGLMALADEYPDGKTSRALRDMGTRLQRGESWETILTGIDRQSSIPPMLRGMLQAGLPPHELAKILSQTLEYTRRGQEARRRIRVSLLYSGFLMALLVVSFSLMLIFIVPQFKSIFLGFGTELPQSTQLVIDVSDSAAESPIGFILCCAAGIAICYGLFQWIGAVNRAKLAAAIPLVGPAKRCVSVSTFCHLLGLSVEYRLPLSAALRIAGGGCRDAELDAGAQRMALEVERGETLAAAVKSRPEFPVGVAGAFQYAYRGDTFSDAMHSLGDAYESDSHTRAGTLSVVIEPLTFILIATSMMFVVSSLMLPLLKLLNDLS